MKTKIKILFDDIVENSIDQLPLRYYGKIQMLAGLVYNKETDSSMDNDLKELSLYVQQLTNIEKLENQIRFITPRGMDYHHMFDTGLDYRLQNLTQVTINFPKIINFPEQNQPVPEIITNTVLENYKNLKTCDFNAPLIIAWIKNKIDIDESMPEKE